jgi:hypothetical protein
MTGAYLPGAAPALESSLRHECTVTAVLVPFAPLVLDAEALTVTFSEDWSPQIQASITVPAGMDAGLYDVLDPQKRCKILIDAGYTYPDNTADVHPLAELYLRTRPVRRPDNTMELTASSGESLAQDAKLDPWTSWSPNRAGLTEWVTWLVTYAMYPETPEITSTFAAGYSAAAMADIPVEAGMDCWSLIAEAASRAGAWVYADGPRWIITGRPTDSGTVAHTVKTGPHGTAFSTQAQISRDGFANSCLITYRWKEAGVDKLRTGYAEISTGPLAPASAGRVGDATERTGPVTAAAANTAAASRLANLASRGRSVLLEAHAAYWLRPSQTIMFQLPTGEPERALVRSVTFAPLTGSMNITTRQAFDVPMNLGE